MSDDESRVDAVWRKGREVPEENLNIWRRDAYGRLIRRGQYGTRGDHGWEIDHKTPLSKGGSDNLSNLQPLHWRSNQEQEQIDTSDSERRIDVVWRKGQMIPGRDPRIWRRDAYSRPMRRDAYGMHGEYGWEIDHKFPLSKGGSDDLRNLQPLHWRSNQEQKQIDTSDDERRIDVVWCKGGIVLGQNPSIWRRDAYGRLMRRDAYSTRGEHGWEVDHIIPRSKGGSDELSNLQPLHWRSNQEKAGKAK